MYDVKKVLYVCVCVCVCIYIYIYIYIYISIYITYNYVNYSVITLSQYIICIIIFNRLDLGFHLQFHNFKVQYVLPYTEVTEQFIQK